MISWLPAVLGLASLVAWLYLLLLRGRFWALALAPAPAGAPSTARITVVIPARDEAAGIGPAVTSLLSQNHAGPVRIVLVDDHSTDGTAEIARRAAEAIGAPDRLTILQARDLPPGWTGKLWAVSEGLAHAKSIPSDFLLLTDADIVHGPANLATLSGRAEIEQRDLVSLMVKLRCRSPAERAFIPAFIFFFFMLYPPRWIADPASRMAGAAGGCMLVRPAALDRIGGIAAIRGALIDDCALAAAVKKSGGRIRLDVTEDAHSIRDYAGWREIWAMVARTAFTQLHYSTLMLAGTVLGLAVTYLAPPLLAIFATGPARWLGLAAWLAMATAFWPTVRFYRLHLGWALALPAIAAFYAAATIGSAVNYWRGKGGQWKGRAQAIRSTNPSS
ncbi:MAG TPA: glycosyltransferase [Aliidongia sp.]|nr:glycosyltransferase [Aliidongia sp.]